MISNTYKLMPPELAIAAMHDYYMACQFYSTIPEPAEGEAPWSCHAIGRAFCKINPQLGRTKLPWKGIDGLWGLSNHAWLQFMAEKLTLILDIYPVGSLTGPVLIVKPPKIVMANLFNENGGNYTPEELANYNDEAARLLHCYRIAKVANTNGEGP